MPNGTGEDTSNAENNGGQTAEPISDDLLIHVDADSSSPTVEWSENLYDRIMEEAEKFGGGLHHDRELAIVGQGIDKEAFVVCPEPRGTLVEPALREIGFNPERVENGSPRTVFRIESNMKIDQLP